MMTGTIRSRCNVQTDHYVKATSIAASSWVRPRHCRCRPRATPTSPAATSRVRVGFLGCGGRAQAHIDLVNRLAAQGSRSRRSRSCDVWDGLEDEYEVEFGGKVTRRRYSQGLYPSARKCGLDPRRQGTRHEGLPRRARPEGRGRGVHRHARPLARQMTVDALAAGKDVYVEKPMTRTAGGGGRGGGCLEAEPAAS